MRGRINALIAVTTACAAGLTALSGCTQSSAQPGGGAGPARALTRTEQVRVDHAEQLLIQQCMKKNGFRYWVDPPADADTRRAFTYRFVQDDVAWAREHGYGGRLKKAFFALKKRDRNLAYRKRLSAADRSRFTDTLGGGPDTPMLSIRLPAGGAVRSPDGGCQHNARRKLYGDTEAFFRNDKIATNLVAVYMSKIMDDPRFKKGLDAWSRCMRDETGRDFANPEAARTDALKRAEGRSTSQAHKAEVESAVAEATCARKSSLPRTLSRLDRKYGDPVRDRYADEIAASNRMKAAALRQAERIEHHD